MNYSELIINVNLVTLILVQCICAHFLGISYIVVVKTKKKYIRS